MRRFNIKEIYSCPKRRRMMIARGTVAIQAREGIDITLEEALQSYDRIQEQKKQKKKTK
jgi:hypothetical protein